MDDWRPATIPEVNEIVAKDLKACDAEQLAAFDKYGSNLFQHLSCDTDRLKAWLSLPERVIRSFTGKLWKMGSMSHRLVLMDKFLSTGAIRTNYGLHSMPGSRAADCGGDLGLLCL